MTEYPVVTSAPPDLLRLSDLDDAYVLLDKLPESLLPTVVTHPVGELQPRVSGVVQLRRTLLKGETPAALLPWPAPAAQSALFQSLESQGVLRYCRDNTEVVDALLGDLLEALEHKSVEQRRLHSVLLQQYQQEALEQLGQERKAQKRRAAAQRQPVLTQNQLAGLSRRAFDDSWIEASSLGVWLPGVWQERLVIWSELEAIFVDLGMVVRLGFDLSRGFFQSHGWLDMVRLKKVLSQLPQLQDVIRTLGRMKSSEAPPIIEIIMESMLRTRQEQREVRTPFVPMETRGITRSDSVSRMLPQEAALFGHPVLKKLWHAKRAEHALLSYAVEGTELETVEAQVDEQVEVKRAGKSSSEERGPMIVCLDTSGSMRGTPETIAKALVLETLSVAASERRGCYVYLFGSSGEVKELELKPDENGLNRLISFLCMSFGGGTDVNGPLQLALDRCKQSEWRNADILVVSDGEFCYPNSLLNRIKRRKKSHGLAVQGILIGEGGGAMERMCDPLHHFCEWLNLACQ
ncbi:hypothetical protein A8C75_11700 [Marinobacterium aestuarii]|uniref:VWFA domain-containing protein n=1 Tax=Marinobacterium aestuarii TaxID=1821621 RepID=A0A1A9EZA2_9GAMM|nr:VWA domain-containing protein [Marinobacterium aestuarii]ANG63070.1 hypothetical protein A8C75_11700 [Marinobacterium aestuarii]